MRDLIKQTDDEIQAILDGTYTGIEFDCCEHVLTADSIDDFKNGICKQFYTTVDISDVDSSVKLLLSENIQTHKGQRRFDLLVLDFGKVRMCFKY